MQICFFAQAHKSKKINSLTVSMPTTWNRSEASSHLPNRQILKGEALSYGLNINYSKSMYKNFFGKIGVGFFQQSFGIKRAFQYNSGALIQPDIMRYTDTYSYKNIHYMIGLGYLMSIDLNTKVSIGVNYNNIFSFKQKYILRREYKTFQTTNLKLMFVNYYIVQLEFENKTNKQISIGGSVDLPINIS